MASTWDRHGKIEHPRTSANQHCLCSLRLCSSPAWPRVLLRRSRQRHLVAADHAVAERPAEPACEASGVVHTPLREPSTTVPAAPAPCSPVAVSSHVSRAVRRPAFAATPSGTPAATHALARRAASEPTPSMKKVDGKTVVPVYLLDNSVKQLLVEDWATAKVSAWQARQGCTKPSTQPPPPPLRRTWCCRCV